jgi:hypothetical protein
MTAVSHLGSARASRVAFGASPNACFYSQKRKGNFSFPHGKIENTKMKVRLGEGQRGFPLLSAKLPVDFKVHARHRVSRDSRRSVLPP